ncbi:MAG: hypothetical protein GXP62_08070 [Oligoflexia bacterium]|nr:hypothetical protein [Oligoflexia bacterium]
MRHSAALLVGLTLVACKRDRDKDGFTSDVDCNDNNSAVYPDAPELCNSIDDDCDGTVDNDAGDIWYLDADADGYGDGNAELQSCNQPTGYVATGDDCDDSDSRYHPGATESDCQDPNDYNCDGSVGYADADGDSFPACQDCDDTSSAINPSADEVCDGIDNDCDKLVDAADDSVVDAGTWYLDYDGDGYGSSTYVETACEQPKGYVDNGDDCDDARVESNPGAKEICDGYDNNCNGTIDENAGDLVSYWADVDGDGYGDPATEELACDTPPDYVENDQDCDDANVDISPEGDEVCDGVDNDCDGLIDDADTDTLHDSGDLHYMDADTDGYGTYVDFVLTCDTPKGYIDVAGDCDDSDSAVNPDAVEYCDGIDNNCVDGIDENTAVDAVTWYQDVDGDDYGLSDTTTVACSQPADYAPVADDCDDTDAAINPDAAEVCNNGVDDNCDGGYSGCALSLADADVVLTGEASLDNAGVGFTGLGDLNGDGFDEVIVGATANDTAATDAGAAYLFLGPVSSGTVASVGSADAIILGGDSSDHMGRGFGGGVDIDGDGINDVVTSAPNDESGGSATGAVYVFSGTDLLGATSSLGPDDATATWYGESTYDYLGVSVQMTDLTGDGNPDVVTASPLNDAIDTSAGAIYVFSGPVGGAGVTDLGTGSGWAARMTGESASDQAGSALAVHGDFNGDGYNDLIAGVANQISSTGSTYVVLGPLSGDISLGAADAKILGDSSGVEFGNSVSYLGDQDGDGYDDIVVASQHDSAVGSDAGAVYVYAGTVSVSSLDGGSARDLADATILGLTTGHMLGTAVRGGGDLGGDFDGDGVGDLLVAASTAGDAGEGTTYLYAGPVTGTLGVGDAAASFVGESADDAAGTPVAFVGDLTGSGTQAIGIGAIANDSVGTDSGSFYLIYSLGL